jgi:acyl dehydratase
MSQEHPSLSSSFLKMLPLALKRVPRDADLNTLPDLCRSAPLRLDPGWLAQYRTLVGSSDTTTIPICAPQVLSSGLHFQILRDPQYPWPVLGMVHVRNAIWQAQPMNPSASLWARARLAGASVVARGVEVQIHTAVYEHPSSTDPVWQSVLTALVRHPHKEAPQRQKPPRPDEPLRPCAQSSTIVVPESMGRRYAAISQDANPIHLHRFTAKPFGFPRAIAHGMWTLQRSVSEVEAAMPDWPRRLDVKFIKPVLLPSTLLVERHATPQA